MAAKLKERRVTRDIGPLTLRASIVPSTLDEDNRTVELRWTTGAAVLRSSYWDGDFYEELSLESGHVRMGRLESGAPLLNAHNGFDVDGVLGVVESARIANGEGIATVRFARAEDDETADRIFRKVKDRVIRNVSVGYRVFRYEKIEEEGKVPTFRATDWEPYELSLVPMGADAQAAVRARGAGANPCEFVELDEERTMAAKKTKPDPQGGAPAAPANPVEPTSQERSAPVDEDAIERKGAATERKRAAAISEIGESLGLDGAFCQRHIADGTGIDAFRAAAIDELAERRNPNKPAPGGPPDIVAGEDAGDKWQRGAEDWLITRAAVADLVVAAAKKRGETLRVDPGEFRGLSLLDLARASLERARVRTAGMDRMRLATEALAFRGGYAATGDFPVLLGNVMHKVLLAAYGTTPDTWSRFCAVGSVSDFRAHNRYRMGSFGRLAKLNEHGEFANQSIPDARRESIAADTFGNIIGITRQALVNDDMSAFSRLATMLGRAAKLSVEVDVYALLAENGGFGPAMADGDALFHANHGNIGTSGPLSVANIDEDRVVLAEQKDESGNDFLDLRPQALVLPISLGATAREINDAQFNVDEVSGRRPNTVRGLFGDIVDTPRITGTRRYLFADPAVAPVVEVVYLDGQSEPLLDVQNGWRVDGVEWKVRSDYGVGAIDFRGAVTNAGS